MKCTIEMKQQIGVLSMKSNVSHVQWINHNRNNRNSRNTFELHFFSRWMNLNTFTREKKKRNSLVPGHQCILYTIYWYLKYNPSVKVLYLCSLKVACSICFVRAVFLFFIPTKQVQNDLNKKSWEKTILF